MYAGCSLFALIIPNFVNLCHLKNLCDLGY
nr:MAG TPA: hypothetical protein [Caudoviricetes sp.]DAS49504.1 MAG TPA: hypothetical protein [Caudoviricetes sp.]